MDLQEIEFNDRIPKHRQILELVYLAPNASDLASAEQPSLSPNDDIFREVFKHLEFSDLIRFSLSCKRIFNLARSRLRDNIYSRVYRVAWLTTYEPRVRPSHSLHNGYMCSPGYWMALVKKDPLIAQHVKMVCLAFHAFDDFGREQDTMDPAEESENDEAVEVENSVARRSAPQHFLSHSKFLSEEDKIVWSEELSNFSDASFAFASILFCSLLPRLESIQCTGEEFDSSIEPLIKFVSAVKERESQQTLLNSSPCLLRRTYPVTHNLKSVFISTDLPAVPPWDVLGLFADVSLGITIPLQDLVPLFLLSTITSVEIEAVGAGYNSNAFAWPSDHDPIRSSLRKATFPNARISPEDAHTFISGLANITFFSLSVLKEYRDPQWERRFDQLTNGLINGRPYRMRDRRCCRGLYVLEIFIRPSDG